MEYEARSVSPLLDLLFEADDEGRCLVAPDGSVLRANREWLRSTGFALDRALGASIIDLFPGARDMAFALHSRARAGHHVEVPRHTQLVNGRETWWEGSIDPIPMDGGTGLLITTREVTGDTQSQTSKILRALELERRRLFEVLEALPAMICLLAPDHRVAFGNLAFRKQFGEPAGRHCYEQCFGLNQPCDFCESYRVLESGRPHRWEVKVPGTATVIEAHDFPFTDVDGSPLILEMDIDITERTHAASALKELNETLELRVVDRTNALQQANEKLAADLDAVTRMHALSGRMVEAARIEPLLHETMDTAVAILGADKGTLQLLEGDTLRIVAHFGHEKPFLDFFSAAENVASVCGEATRWGERVLVPDVENDPIFVGTASLPVLRAAGVRAVQSTPLRTRAGRLRGILTTHWGQPHTPGENDLRRLDLLSRQAADLIELKLAEEALRENEQRLHALADSMPQLAWTAQADGYITWYNRRWYEYTGTTPEQMEGWGWQSVHDPAALTHVLRRWQDSIATGTAFEMEFPLRGADGKYRRFLTRIFPLKDDAGTVVQWFGTNTDVTELIEAQEALREGARRKDEFLGMLSHELRNPLAPIRNSSYILKRAEPGSEQARRAQDVIDRQTEHLARLVEDLLDVTRIARGKVEVRRSRVDLREVVSHAADDFRVLLLDRDVRFHIEIPGEKLWADADGTRITQIIGNLLHNAAKFTRRGDEVTLSLAVVEGALAEIRVRDTGPGIEPSLLPSIFDAFVQGERTLARTEGGLGLGLALVKGITELHGGTVRAESAGVGRGSEFVVRLPLVTPSTSDRPQRCVERRQSGLRVLVVDDNRDAAESLADIVRMLGHAAEVAYDGPNAIEKTRANTFNVVLCDIGLPGMSGYEVAKALRAANGHGTQLIAVSGYAQPEDVQKAIEAGFDGHIAKPCDPVKIERLLS